MKSYTPKEKFDARVEIADKTLSFSRGLLTRVNELQKPLLKKIKKRNCKGKYEKR